MYNERIIQVEKGSFTPIVMSTFGGMGEEANRHHKRIALLISGKRNENYDDVLNFIRTRLRFTLLKSILLAKLFLRTVKRKATSFPALLERKNFEYFEVLLGFAMLSVYFKCISGYFIIIITVMEGA